MRTFPIDHIGIATPSLRHSSPLYERMTGLPCSPIEELPEHGVRVAFVGPVELLEPLGDGSPVARFLEKRGPGVHHIAYRVEDIRADLIRLRNEGFRLVDEQPRAGAGGHLVAFVHPGSAEGTLWELVERPPAS